MKKTDKIYWKRALELLDKGEKVLQSTIDFGNDFIRWEFVQKFNVYKINVPEKLIDYEDEKIDYSDILPLEKLLSDGSYKETFTLTFEQDIAKWLITSKIDYNLLINNFLKLVYKSVQTGR